MALEIDVFIQKHAISPIPEQRQNSIRSVWLSKARIYSKKRQCHLYKGKLRAYKISLARSVLFDRLIAEPIPTRQLRQPVQG